MNPIAQYLFDYLQDVFYHPQHAQLDLSQLPDEFQELGKAMQYFTKCIAETTILAQALAKGDLNYSFLPHPENEIAAPLKALHASLKHLTWQTQQVAHGDYKQQVNFMGEFSQAFNTMIVQLNQRRNALLTEIENNKQKLYALEQNSIMLETLSQQIPNWIIVMDGETKSYLFYNRESRHILLDPNQEMVLHDWLAVQTDLIIGQAQQIKTELELKSEDFSQSFTAIMQPLHWHGRIAAAFVLQDISAEKETIRSLNQYAYYDSLTKLPNRRYGMATLDEWISLNKRFCLCFIDIDNLKFVNDNYGHAQGDNYILEIVDTLHFFADPAFLCRIGGDEFMLMIPECNARQLHSQLNQLRSDLYTNNPNPYIQSFSYGIISVKHTNTLSSPELLKKADEAMYAFKRSNKFRFTIQSA